MTAATMQGFATTNKAPITLSVIGHILLLIALSSSVVFMPDAPVPQLAIQAIIVDESKARRSAAAEAEQQEAVRRERAEAARLEQQRDAERRREEQKREQQLQAQQQQEQQRQAELKAQQQKAERAAAERRAADERRRQEAEAAAKKEAARKAAEAAQAQARAAEQREQARREAELAAMLAAEEELAAARSSGAMNRYVTLIAQKVERKWVQPASAVAGVECQVSVQQLPNGEVISARVTQCNGDELVRRSVETAVLAASPLPLPDDRLLFDRNLRFTFRPRVGN